MALLEVILLKTQMNRSRRQRPAHKTETRLREVQRAAFYRRHGVIKRAGVKVKRKIFRVIAGECAVRDRSNDLNQRKGGQIGIKGRRKKERKNRLVEVLLPVEKARETSNSKLEVGLLVETDAKAPSFVNLTCLVWAAKTSGNNTTAARSSFFMIGLSFELVG